MNKLPAKQIYLLVVIIVGIIALSMYSTFAIFTFDSETSDVVNIELPNTLSVSSDMYEYKQLELEPKTTTTTDIDIYNTFEYDLCYSVWYKVIGNNSDQIEIQELNKDNLTTSGTILANDSKRITLLVINNSDSKEILNVGVATNKKEEVCSLKISSDKKTVKISYNKEITLLEDIIKETVNTPKKDEKDGFLTYKNNKEEIIIKNDLIISNNFTQTGETFNLKDQQTINIKELSQKDNPENLTNLYLCKDNNCNILYKINSYELNDNTLIIKDHDILVPYQKGNSGVKKDNNNYYYYGDNPNNFVKFNCDVENNCELWRIMGINYNEKDKKNYIKLIKNDSIGEYEFNTKKTSIWDENNSLYEYLHKEYQLNEELKEMIADYPIIQETINNNEITIKEIKISEEGKKLQNVNTLNISDFLNASTCKTKTINESGCLNGNWLNNGLYDKIWTITNYKEPNPPEEGNQEEIIIEDKVISVGTIIDKNDSKVKLNVKPTLYISNRVLVYEGNGSFDNPYVLK